MWSRPGARTSQSLSIFNYFLFSELIFSHLLNQPNHSLQGYSSQPTNSDIQEHKFVPSKRQNVQHPTQTNPYASTERAELSNHSYYISTQLSTT